MVVVALAVDDRAPAAVPDVLVDASHDLVDLLLELLVPGDPAPAGGRDLGEDHAPPVLGPALEEPADRPEALGQPLGVVDPRDADAQELCGDLQAGQEGRPADGPMRDPRVRSAAA